MKLLRIIDLRNFSRIIHTLVKKISYWRQYFIFLLYFLPTAGILVWSNCCILIAADLIAALHVHACIAACMYVHVNMIVHYLFCVWSYWGNVIRLSIYLWGELKNHLRAQKSWVKSPSLHINSRYWPLSYWFEHIRIYGLECMDEMDAHPQLGKQLWSYWSLDQNLWFPFSPSPLSHPSYAVGQYKLWEIYVPLPQPFPPSSLSLSSW